MMMMMMKIMVKGVMGAHVIKVLWQQSLYVNESVIDNKYLSIFSPYLEFGLLSLLLQPTKAMSRGEMKVFG